MRLPERAQDATNDAKSRGGINHGLCVIRCEEDVFTGSANKRGARGEARGDYDRIEWEVLDEASGLGGQT